jgi:hypothetical protein
MVLEHFLDKLSGNREERKPSESEMRNSPRELRSHGGNLPHVVIGLARCARNKSLFGIRFEERQNSAWTGTWAFAIQEESARKEGYTSDRIQGTFDLKNYPGCPHCGARNFYVCSSCGKLVCLAEIVSHVTCSWCGRSGKLEIRENLEFGTGKDR